MLFGSAALLCLPTGSCSGESLLDPGEHLLPPHSDSLIADAYAQFKQHHIVFHIYCSLL